MKFKPFKPAPVLIALSVIALVCLLRLADFEFFERLERMTYDLRVRAALQFPRPVATNLGFVVMSDQTITALNRGLLGKSYGLYWPRHIYGRMLRELSAQGTSVVAFDVLFGEPRPDHAPVPVSSTQWPELEGFLAALHAGRPPATYENEGEHFVLADSDDYFAWQLRRAGVAVLAAKDGLLPASVFATNALSVADISADADPDGVLRRAKAFGSYTNWHPLFKQVEADPAYGVDLRKAVCKPGRIVLPRDEVEAIEVPVDADNNFELADFVGERLPSGVPPKARAFTVQRVWHMGVVVAARELNLDLERTEVDLERGFIRFRGRDGTERLLPVDRAGYFPINWEITANDPRLTTQPLEQLLELDQSRWNGKGTGGDGRWQNKLAIVGSAATGNDLTDRGATPIEEATLLVTKHFNVANSIITGRFIRRTSTPGEMLLLLVLGVVTAAMTWRLRALAASVGVALLVLVYCVAAVWLYVQQRYWLPLVMPVLGAVIVEHVMLVTYRVVFEERERRRVKSIFSKIVAPDVMEVLLDAETLSLGGARREVTVLFADVRGFTELTDQTQERVLEYVRERNLVGNEAEVCFDEVARETLNTVNRYLSAVADMVKKHGGTLDKYIGDCVMAFWGAPTASPRHALECVRAAIDAQRAIHALNRLRTEENQRIAVENRSREQAGLPPRPLHATLMLGTGINTGPVIVGLMGSEAHQFNYTVFGREVNLASRLEGVSGRGRIVISETTYEQLRRDDPSLAATCIELEPTKPKGFQRPVRNFEVPWQLPDPATTGPGSDSGNAPPVPPQA